MLSRSCLGRSATGLATVMMLAIGVVWVSPASAAGPAAVVADARVAAAGARLAATRGGQRVEVLSARTETAQTFANPDGSFTWEEHTRPQRVRRPDGSWTAPDPALRRNSNGTLSPGAAVVGLAFSGGGAAAPLAEMAKDGRAMRLWWPSPLPVPVVAGATATYPDVLPGVDLKVVADVDRFTHVLVVKTRQAAASPSVARMSLRTSFTGLTVRQAAAGRLEAVDSAGKLVFAGASPVMWDSSAEGTARSEARQAPVATRLVGSTLTLLPDAAMLADPRSVFPLQIDPEWSYVEGGRSHHTVLRKTFPTQSNYDRFSGLGNNDDTSGVMRSGYNDSSGTAYTDRSLFQMDISAVRNAHIDNAKFILTHSWSGAGCASSGRGYWTDLRHMLYTFDAGTTWNTDWNRNDYGWGSILASSDVVHRYGDSCAPQKVEFDVTSQTAAEAAAGNSYLWLGLRGRSESSNNYWRRYQPDAIVAVRFNRFPNRPEPTLTDGKPCGTGTSRPWATTDSPILAATQTDTDTGQSVLTTDFYWWEQDAERTEANKVSGSGQNNAASPVTAAIPAGRLSDARTYVWQARTSDGIDYGQFSTTCEFSADLSPPNDPGVVSATFYSNTTPSGGPGIPDTFTFNPPSTLANEVVGYAYTLDGGTNPAAGVQVSSINPNTFVGTATVAPSHDGSTTMRVWTKDRASRYSRNAAMYTFLVSPGGLAANWTFEVSTPAADTTGHNNGLTFSPAGLTVIDGRSSTGTAPNKALPLTGASYAETTTSPVKTKVGTSTVDVRTDGSFTVSAWVRINAAGANDQTAVAVNGASTAAFMLGYGGAENRRVFRMAESDLASPQLRTVVSNAAPVAGRWTHLTGTYDSATRQLRLYVGGMAQTATANLGAGFNATGKLSIGSQLWNGAAHGKPLTGAADDVSLYNTLITPADIQLLARPLRPTVTVLAPAPIAAGTPVQVRFDANGDTNVTNFRYSVGPALDKVVTGMTATVTLTGLPVGLSKVYAKARDGNGLESLVSVVELDVVANPTLVGFVFDPDGNPVEGATVSLSPGGLTTTSAGDGSYSFTGFPGGHYTVSAVLGQRCGLSANTDLDIVEDTAVDLVLGLDVVDAYGYRCDARGTGSFVPGDTALALVGDNAVVPVSTPFAVPFYDRSIGTVWVDTNGVLYTEDPGGSHPVGTAAPNRAAPNGLIAPFWTDLYLDSASAVYTAVVGAAPQRQFVVEWRNARLAADPAQRLSFEVVLAESGDITFRYADIDTPAEAGSGAVVGIESAFGSTGIGYSANDAALTSDTSVSFRYPETPTPLPTYTISGTVTAAGVPARGVTVTLDPLGLAAVTDPAGHYEFAGMPDGDYHLVAQLCLSSASADLTLTANTVQDFALPVAADSFGYTCTVRSQAFVPADQTVLDLSGDDRITDIAFPFIVPLYGEFRDAARISTNGFLALDGSTDPAPGNENTPIPSPDGPNGVIAPFWDDVVVDESASVRTAVTGTAPHRQFVVEWRNVTLYDEPSARLSFEVILGEDGEVSFGYAGLDTDAERGGAATVGLENLNGTSGRIVSYRQPVLVEGEAIAFAYPGGIPTPDLSITGTVTVGGSVLPAGVNVALAPSGQTAVTDQLGRFQFDTLFPGTYTVTANHCGQTGVTTVTIGTDTALGTLDLAAAPPGGYLCAEGPSAFIAADTPLDLYGDDVFVSVTTPFPVSLYGFQTSTLSVNTDGAVFVTGVADVNNTNHAPIPSAAYPNGIVAPFWDDLVVDDQASVRTTVIGSAPNRQFVIEWRNVSFYGVAGDPRVTFEVVFAENGQITFGYAGLDSPRERGSMAVIGLESVDGGSGVNHGYHRPVLVDGRAITFTPAA